MTTSREFASHFTTFWEQIPCDIRALIGQNTKLVAQVSPSGVMNSMLERVDVLLLGHDSLRETAREIVKSYNRIINEDPEKEKELLNSISHLWN